MDVIGIIQATEIIGLIEQAKVIGILEDGMVKIINGSAVQFNIKLLQLPSGCEDRSLASPFNLTGVTALTTCFQNADGTETMLSLGSGISVVGDPQLGIIQVSITAAQSANFVTVTGQSLELAITFSGDPVKYQIPNAYEVVAGLC